MKTWFKYSTPLEKILCCCLIGSHVFIFLFVLKDTPYFGDERYYSSSSTTLYNMLLNWNNPHVHAFLIKQLVGSGYFMPFYSATLVPLKYFDINSSGIRLIYMLINLCFSIILVVQYRKYFGARFAQILLVIFTLLPSMVFFNASITPEGFTAKLILLAMLLLYRLANADIKWSRLFLFTLLMACIVLFRQSTVFLFPAICIWFIMHEIESTSFLSIAKKLTTILLPSTIIITVAILHWSSFLNEKYGPGYLTTTSTDLSFMVLWGEGVEDLGDHNNPSVWNRLKKYYLEKSRSEGVTFKEAVRIDKKEVWDNLTLSRYFQGVNYNIKRFFDPKSAKVKYIFKMAGKLKEKYAINNLRTLNVICCYIILLSLLLFLLAPRMIIPEHRKLLSLLVFIIPFLLVHIFVARANGRHGMVMWWLLAILGSVVISNLIRYIENGKNEGFLKEPMTTTYAIIVNLLRVFSVFMLMVLLLG